MSTTTRNTEFCELTESQLDNVSGGNPYVDAWYQALGRLNLPLPNQGNWMTDLLYGCSV